MELTGEQWWQLPLVAYVILRPGFVIFIFELAVSGQHYFQLASIILQKAKFWGPVDHVENLKRQPCEAHQGWAHSPRRGNRITLISWYKYINSIKKIKPYDFGTLEIQSDRFFKKNVGPDSGLFFSLQNCYPIYYPNLKTFHVWQHFIKSEAVSKMLQVIEHDVHDCYMHAFAHWGSEFLVHRSIEHCLCSVSVARVVWFFNFHAWEFVIVTNIAFNCVRLPMAFWRLLMIW